MMRTLGKGVLAALAVLAALSVALPIAGILIIIAAAIAVGVTGVALVFTAVVVGLVFVLLPLIIGGVLLFLYSKTFHHVRVTVKDDAGVANYELAMDVSFRPLYREFRQRYKPLRRQGQSMNEAGTAAFFQVVNEIVRPQLVAAVRAAYSDADAERVAMAPAEDLDVDVTTKAGYHKGGNAYN